MKKMWISGENNAGKCFNSVDNIIDNSRDIKKLYELKRLQNSEKIRVFTLIIFKSETNLVKKLL